MATTAYTGEFYDAQSSESRRSADTIAPLVFDEVEARSVVDVGCGVGTWLASFLTHGTERVLGLDGDYVDRERLQIPRESFRPWDLEQRVDLEETFDLAISLEVAEHLPPARSATFVEDLVGLAPCVLFSAAIPGQGGTHHVNERWQSDWAAMFAAHGYQPVDSIRPKVWQDPAVNWWYAQNVVLYRRDARDAVGLPLDVVHPELFRQSTAEVNRQPTLREAGATFRRSVGFAMRHRFR
jgi:SAM-dependent methyltransferase